LWPKEKRKEKNNMLTMQNCSHMNCSLVQLVASSYST
jgi:hypothetical protein